MEESKKLEVGASRPQISLRVSVQEGVLLLSDLLWGIRQTSLWSLSVCGLHLSLGFGLEGAVKSTQLCKFKKDLGGHRGRQKKRKGRTGVAPFVTK